MRRLGVPCLIHQPRYSMLDRWIEDGLTGVLEQEGIGPEPARAALSELLPEPERAAALAAGSPDPRAAWRLLARRGFSSDSIEHAVGVLDENA